MPPEDPSMPTVQGISVEYDTLKGIARLRWRPVKHPLIQDYLLYRGDDSGAPVPGGSFAHTADTFFIDTLWNPSAGDTAARPGLPFAYSDMAVRAFTWRVRARLKTGEIGPFGHSASAQAISPAWIATRTSLALAWRHPHTATVNDSLPLVVKFFNPLHRIQSIRWYDDPGSPPVRVSALSAREGSDTLPYRSGDSPSNSLWMVSLIDEAGIETRDSISIQVVDDAPDISLWRSSRQIGLGDTFTLRGSGDDLGRIVRWEWCISPDTACTASSRPETTFQVTYYPPGEGEFVTALRAVDDDGNVTTVKVETEVFPWKYLQDMTQGRDEFVSVALEGKIYVLDDGVDAYDPSTNTWSRKTPMRHPRQAHQAIAYGKEIMLVGGWGDGNQGRLETEFYNPESDTWRIGPSLNHARAHFGLVQHGGRVFALEGRGSGNGTGGNLSLEVYDSLSGKWDLQTWPDMPARSHFSAVVLDGKAYTFGGVTDDVYLRKFSKRIHVYDLEKGTVTEGPELEAWPYSRPALAYGHRILLASGELWGPDGPLPNDRIESMDPLTGERRLIGKIHPPRIRASLVSVGGKVFHLGGQNQVDFVQVRSQAIQVFMPSLDSVLAEIHRGE